MAQGIEYISNLFILMLPLLANPTSITYLNRESSREEHVAIKDKEKLKNEKYSQRFRMIDSL